MAALPKLDSAALAPTRDYLQDIALVLGCLQRAFVPKHPRDWHYGLNVTMRGPTTQPFVIGGEHVHASLDLVRHKVRLSSSNWPLEAYAAPEIMNNIRLWLENHMVSAELEVPELSGATQFDEQQAKTYAEALWWLDRQFRVLADRLQGGVVSPILLYPHHFDLSLVWFPYGDDKQLAVGFSTGDDSIAEPYIYLTAYPETSSFRELALPAEAHRQTNGFSGAILPYAKLQASAQPEKLFGDFTAAFTQGKALF